MQYHRIPIESYVYLYVYTYLHIYIYIRYICICIYIYIYISLYTHMSPEVSQGSPGFRAQLQALRLPPEGFADSKQSQESPNFYPRKIDGSIHNSIHTSMSMHINISIDIRYRYLARYAWLFLWAVGPVCGCPYNESPTIWDPYSNP